MPYADFWHTGRADSGEPVLVRDSFLARVVGEKLPVRIVPPGPLSVRSPCLAETRVFRRLIRVPGPLALGSPRQTQRLLDGRQGGAVGLLAVKTQFQGGAFPFAGLRANLPGCAFEITV